MSVGSLNNRIRDFLPIEVRVAASNARRVHRAQRADVHRHLELPRSLVPARRRRGSVWGVAMMRNEVDTARQVVEHMFAQGVDAVLVADNNSDDGTADVLEELALVQSVHVARDRLLAYTQATKMTILASLARRSGADWIVPFDADELWFTTDGTVSEFLRSSDATVARAELHNVFPAPDDDRQQIDPFLRLRRLDESPAQFGKVAFRSHPLARIEMGNLDVDRRGRRIDGLFIAHFPWRSLEQMTAKLRNGRIALEATDLPVQLGDHWRAGGTWSDEQLAETWGQLVQGRHVEQLTWSPCGPFVPVSAGSASTWSDVWRGASDEVAS